MVLVPSNAPRHTTLRLFGAISLAQASRCDEEPVGVPLSGDLGCRCCWFGVFQNRAGMGRGVWPGTNTQTSNFIRVHMDTVD